MPTPRLWRTLATSLRPFRRWAVWVCIAAWVFGALVGLLALQHRLPAALGLPVLVILSAFFLISWWLICLVSWFHPVSGVLWREPRFRLFRAVRGAERWWAAFMLVLLLLFSVALAPVILWLRYVRAG